jgi:hypothetical protein
MKLTKPQQLAALMPLIRLAGEAVPNLPHSQRADILEGIAIITRGLNTDMHTSALMAAQSIRDAEVHQMTFAEILQARRSA